jgi:Uma2 family endonuclease
MATLPLPYVTPEQYLEYDRNAEFKNEYYYGEIVCMAGGKPRHARITANVIAELHSRLSGRPCGVYSPDLRVCVNKKTGYVYPDVTVVCGPLDYVDEREDTITNPKIAVEVLSPTTRNRDLGEKARLYWDVPSLSDLIFIEQDTIGIEHWQRSSDGDWRRTVVKAPDGVLKIASLDCEIPVSQLYLGAELTAADE